MGHPKKPDAIDIIVGNAIRMRRVTIGMSQEKLGEHMGITFQQIQKYEKGTNRVSASKLWRVAETLGVKIEYFFIGAGDLPTDEDGGALDSRVQNAEEMKLLAHYRSLTRKGKGAVSDMAEVLSGAQVKITPNEQADAA